MAARYLSLKNVRWGMIVVPTALAVLTLYLVDLSGLAYIPIYRHSAWTGPSWSERDSIAAGHFVTKLNPSSPLIKKAWRERIVQEDTFIILGQHFVHETVLPGVRDCFVLTDPRLTLQRLGLPVRQMSNDVFFVEHATTPAAEYSIDVVGSGPPLVVRVK